MENCIFCKIINGEIPSYTIFEDDLIKIFLDINPSSNGHCLVIPKKHFVDINDIDSEYLNHIYLPIVIVVLVSVLLPIYLHTQMSEGFLRLLCVGTVCVISVGCSVFLLGLTKGERSFFTNKIVHLLKIKK
jgi:hypothetical protein